LAEANVSAWPVHANDRTVSLAHLRSELVGEVGRLLRQAQVLRRPSRTPTERSTCSTPTCCPESRVARALSPSKPKRNDNESSTSTAPCHRGPRALGVARRRSPGRRIACATAGPEDREEVTGSNIKRVEGEGPSAIVVLTKEDIDKSGATNAYEF
jgi:hypothetical protein